MKKKIQRSIAEKISRWMDELNKQSGAKKLGQFKSNPNNLVIDEPYRLINPQCIEMGDDVYLGPNSMLCGNTSYPSEIMQAPQGTPTHYFEPKISIGNRVSATGGLQVGAFEKIVIEDDVLFATNVHMTDGFHGYDSVDVPYKFQPISQISPIIVKKGSWIGQNVVISPGVTIGEMVIIGANSVVTQNVPEYSIAVGVPAKVIKQWCFQTNQWRKA